MDKTEAGKEKSTLEMEKKVVEIKEKGVDVKQKTPSPPPLLAQLHRSPLWWPSPWR
jgi:hypothetical protein